MKNATLNGLTHSQVTNLKAGRISNHDAALLILASFPGFTATSRQVRKDLISWRPGRLYHYLFNTCSNSGYGFVGKDFASTSNRVYHYPSDYRNGKKVNNAKDCYSQRRTYWYRVARGIYRLTAEGHLRLKELQASV